MQSSIHDLRPRSKEFPLKLTTNDLLGYTIDEVLFCLKNFLKVILFVFDILLLVLFLHFDSWLKLIPLCINNRLGNTLNLVDIISGVFVAIWWVVTVFFDDCSPWFLDRTLATNSLLRFIGSVRPNVYIFRHPWIRLHLVTKQFSPFFICFIDILMNTWVVRIVELWRFPGVIRGDICHGLSDLKTIWVLEAGLPTLWHNITSLTPDVWNSFI